MRTGFASPDVACDLGRLLGLEAGLSLYLVIHVSASWLLHRHTVADSFLPQKGPSPSWAKAGSQPLLAWMENQCIEKLCL